MESLKSLLPQAEGLLPKWLLIVSVVAAMNSVQSYATLKFTQRVYSGRAATETKSKTKSKTGGEVEAYPSHNASSSSSPVTPLSARTFGTWTFLSAVVRFYAAYHIGNRQVYELCFWTYGLAFAHFMSEWLLFRSANWGAGLAGPAFVSTGSLVWMWLQWDDYVLA